MNRLSSSRTGAAEESPEPGRSPYDSKFFDNVTLGAIESARVLLPILFEYVRPRSVVDVGCGRGAWLQVLQEFGAERVLGLDGAYVERSTLVIAPADFRATDLSRPFAIDGTFDLAICLEVAEHLPEQMALPLVETLTRAAPFVLFSAAIPGQAGVGHVNLQWPAFWQERFERFGFRKLDPIRRRVWQDPRVCSWYQQNVYLYASAAEVEQSERLQEEIRRVQVATVELIDRSILVRYTYFSGLLGQLPRAAWRAIRRRLPWRRAGTGLAPGPMTEEQER